MEDGGQEGMTGGPGLPSRGRRGAWPLEDRAPWGDITPFQGCWHCSGFELLERFFKQPELWFNFRIMTIL